MRSLQQFWSIRRMGEDRVTLARLGCLRIWLARADKEWGFAHEHGEATEVMDIAQVPEDVVPGELSWTNMLFKSAPREYLLRPAVPDRPVVVKPLHPVSIPPGESGVFFVLLPVFIELVLVAGRSELVAGAIPSRKLSDTWFGTLTAGDLCYSLPMPATMDLSLIQVYPHQIVCPVEIGNHSDEVLVLEKLCLRPRHVGLYSGTRHLWSSVVRIQHEGLFRGASVRYSGSQPEFEDGLVEVTKPQKREERGLYGLTFASPFSKDIIFGR